MGLAIQGNYMSSAFAAAGRFHSVKDYSNYLINKYKCLTPCKSASVTISPGVMQKALRDDKTAKWLEENLAIMPDVFENARNDAARHGSRLVSAEMKITTDGIEMTTSGIFGDDSVNSKSELDEWIEKLKEETQKGKKEKNEDMLLEETLNDKLKGEGQKETIGFDTYI